MADMSVVALGAVVGYVVVSYIQKTKAQSDADKIAALLRKRLVAALAVLSSIHVLLTLQSKNPWTTAIFWASS